MATPRKILLPDAPPRFQTLEPRDSDSAPEKESTQTSRSPRPRFSPEQSEPTIVAKSISKTRTHESNSKQDHSLDHSLDSKDSTKPPGRDPVIWVGGLLVVGLVLLAFFNLAEKQSATTEKLAPEAQKSLTVAEFGPEVESPKMTQRKSGTEMLADNSVSDDLSEQTEPSLLPTKLVEKVRSEPTEAITASTPKKANLEWEADRKLEKQKAPQIPVVAKLKVINVVRGDTLSVRKAPSAASPRIGRIPAGATGIGLISHAGRQNGRDIWYQVVWDDKVGWVNGSFVDFQ